MTLDRHASLTYCLAYSPDGSLLASGGVERSVRLWDMTQGQERSSFEGHTGTVQAVAFSPDGATVVSGSGDRTIKLWDVRTGRERATLRGHQDAICSLAVSPDGKTLASASNDRSVRLWDMATGQQRALLTRHRDHVLVVAFAPDGQTLASGGEDRFVYLWDSANGEPRQALLHEGPVSALAFTRDSSLLAVGLENTKFAIKHGEIRLWDVKSASDRGAVREGHTFMVTALAFLPAGEETILAAASKDWTVKLWKLPGLTLTATLTHTNPVWGLAALQDGTRLATACGDETRKLGELRIWDRETQQPVAFGKK